MSGKELATFDLLDQLELMVENAKTIPLYGRIMLEKQECTSLVRRIRESLEQGSFAAFRAENAEKLDKRI